MHSDKVEDKTKAYEIVQNLAVSIDKFVDQQALMEERLDQLTKTTEDLSELINAIGPILVDIVELMQENNNVLADLTGEDESFADERDIDNLTDGLKAILRRIKKNNRKSY